MKSILKTKQILEKYFKSSEDIPEHINSPIYYK